MIISVTSAREHRNVALTGPGPPELISVESGGLGYIWKWKAPVSSTGGHSYSFLVNYAVYCTSNSFVATPRWEQKGEGLAGTNKRFRALVLSPDFPFDHTAFLGLDGVPGEVSGVYKSTNAHEAATWTAMNTGLTDIRVLSLAVSPNYRYDGTLFVGTRGGLFKSTNGGNSWSLSGFAGMAVHTVLFSPNYATDGTVFVGREGVGVFISIDRGVNWYAINDGLTDLVVQALTISANYANDGIIFVGTRYSGVYRFTATGPRPVAAARPNGQDFPEHRALSAVAAELPSGLPSLQLLQQTPTPTPTVTATPTHTPSPTPTPRPWQWVSINDAGLEDLWIWSFAISPFYANDRTLYAGSAYGGLFKYVRSQEGIDCGALPKPPCWVKVNKGFPTKWAWVRSIGISPRFPSEATLYAGTKAGVYKSADGGSTWSALNAGLPRYLPDLSGPPEQGVYALALSPDYTNDGIVFAAVWENNIYRLKGSP